jgi:ABC-type nitrate/sulfonate/bicarbonate transport system substrate-binding protein
MKARYLKSFSKIPILFVLLALVISVAHPVKAASPPIRPEMAKLIIGLPVPAISFLPVWVADQNGLLKEEGITDAKILAFRGDADVIQALAGGSVDLNVASLTGLVSTINSGQKFKGVWAGYNMPFFDWYAQPKV